MLKSMMNIILDFGTLLINRANAIHALCKYITCVCARESVRGCCFNHTRVKTISKTLCKLTIFTKSLVCNMEKPQKFCL